VLAECQRLHLASTTRTGAFHISMHALHIHSTYSTNIKLLLRGFLATDWTRASEVSLGLAAYALRLSVATSEARAAVLPVLSALQSLSNWKCELQLRRHLAGGGCDWRTWVLHTR
jgi:hypothetical protein